MKLVEAVRRANQPGAHEHSVRLRMACTLAVLVAIAASTAEGEVSRLTAFVGGALVVAGMAFSYRTREHPPGWIKVVAALSAVLVLVWFFHQLTTHPVTDITAVEDPLTLLFISIQVVHSFHVPARRDLLFSIAASSALMAVAAAQAIDFRFAWYAGVWMAMTLWALVELWRSASGGAKVSSTAIGTSLVGVSLAAAVVFFVLPAPVVSIRISFQSRASSAGPVPEPGALAGDSGSASQLSKPGSPGGRTRVGGYLGFANSLDTALRGRLGNTVVMRVRAERPSYWIGETFDTWNGESWVATKTTANHVLRESSPFDVPVPGGDKAAGQPDLQTFYIATSGPDLVFHADTARQLWFPSNSVFFGFDGTLVSPIGLGKGAIYTVESSVLAPTSDQLRQDLTDSSLGTGTTQEYTQLPHAYPQAAVLAKSVTAGTNNTYDKVESLINWIGTNTHYSTDIPPLPAGADTVNDFLFGNRVGFCEQISTSLAVMLRSLGIPVREVVGYVPDSYNPITDLYEVRAKDAHAWVQVWFPGYGWQSFDPTAVVPLANPSPGATALHDLGHAFGRIPATPVGGAIGGLAVIVGFVRWRRSRPATWADAVAIQMERAGRRARRPRRPSETIVEYASALQEVGAGEWGPVASGVARGVYGSDEPSLADQREMLAAARRLRASVKLHRRRSSYPPRRESDNEVGADREGALASVGTTGDTQDRGASPIGLVFAVLIMGGLAAGVLISVQSRSSGPGSIPSLPTVVSHGTGHSTEANARANPLSDISAAAIEACQTSYSAAEEA
jgi:protein-glutamine gamma-glutamyltransferase